MGLDYVGVPRPNQGIKTAQSLKGSLLVFLRAQHQCGCIEEEPFAVPAYYDNPLLEVVHLLDEIPGEYFGASSLVAGYDVQDSQETGSAFVFVRFKALS
jgi:hypothetical protein